ncbi:type VI secretion system membrane subunit TssM [Pseudomonas sp.]|jgi:type VI secretion system protein ImpL|uniref:type VI secretion system membrane subunit TssM n=1 Tax=Pseudomonas sp. TaxID=306 RepID=UPI00272D9F72|nr:type VI secretion system membrane subunit TssM [Pseudomonas sp.]
MKTYLFRGLTLFRRSWAWSLVLVLALAALVWTLGPALAINDRKPWGTPSARLLTISMLFLGWGMSLVFNSWKSARKQKAEESDSEAQERLRRENLIVEEQAELHGRFKQALRTLSRSSLYKGRSERWRQELPWYLLLGPQGSGKTSLLEFSGLEFPLNEQDSKRSNLEISGTRYAEWYFAEHGVLLDTTGRYLTQPDPNVDSLGWQTLLGLLRTRRQRPLNGVLVNIPVELLLSDNQLELETLARQTRQRLLEINQKLGMEVPVYLVLSKSDRIPGFDEYFDQLSADENDQVLGASFRKGQDGTDLQVVRGEFESVLHRLNSQVITRMHQERDIARRGRILDFPHQLGRLGEPLSLFIELAFAGNRYQRATQLRGFYLTSAPSMEAGLDPLTTRIGRNLGPTGSPLPAQRSGRARFIRHLLSRVIFPEAELAGLDQREIRRINWRQRALYASAALVMVVSGLAWTNSFSVNHGRLEQLRTLAQKLERDQRDLLDVSQTERMVEILDQSYAATRVYPPRRDTRWRERAGLYQGDELRTELNEAYLHNLEELLLRSIAQRLEAQVSASSHDREKLFSSLRAYLMLNLQNRRNKAWLAEWMAADWSHRFPGNSALQNSLNEHFNRLLNHPFKAYPLDQQLVTEARQYLRDESLATVLYRVLVEQAGSLPEYRLINHLGPRGALLTSNQNSLPGLYTRAGYQQVFLARGNDLVQHMLRDNWVLGDSDTLSAQDLQRLMQEMEQLYFEDYANHWTEMLALLAMDPLGDASQAAQQLTGLAAANSPIVKLLEELRTNTRLSDQSAASNRAMRSMERRFEPLHQLLDDNGNPGSEMLQALQALDALHNQLNTLAHASVPGQAAFDMARARIAGQPDAINLVRASAARLPQPVGGWLTAVARDSWMLVLNDTYQYVSQRYRSELLAAWRSSVGERYPFARESESEVTLGDFREFFKVGGTADKFFDRYLQPFVNSSGDGYRVRQIDGSGLPISRDMLAQLGRVEHIRRSFFAENPNEPQVSFRLEPFFLDSNLGRASLRIGYQNMEYRHGPIIQTAFRWPTEADTGRTSLVLEDLGGRRMTLDHNRGLWSLFRLLDELEVGHHSERDVLLLKANLSGMRAQYLLHSQRSPNPFDLALLREFKLPARL